MSTKRIRVRTAADGSYTSEHPFQGVVRCVEVLLGDLVSPDVVVTDGTYGTSVYSGSGLVADATTSYLSVPVMGTLKVEVTGAGGYQGGLGQSAGGDMSDKTKKAIEKREADKAKKQAKSGGQGKS